MDSPWIPPTRLDVGLIPPIFPSDILKMPNVKSCNMRKNSYQVSIYHDIHLRIYLNKFIVQLCNCPQLFQMAPAFRMCPYTYLLLKLPMSSTQLISGSGPHHSRSRGVTNVKDDTSIIEMLNIGETSECQHYSERQFCKRWMYVRRQSCANSEPSYHDTNDTLLQHVFYHKVTLTKKLSIQHTRIYFSLHIT